MTSHLGDQDHTEPFLAIRARLHASTVTHLEGEGYSNPEGDSVKTSMKSIISVQTQTSQNNESEND
jgi:hypothetical protein